MPFTRTLCTRARAAALSLALVALASVGQAGAAPQEFGNSDRDRGRTILNVIKKDLQKHYYDAGYRGIDLEARFKAAEERIGASQSNGEVFAVIAQALIELRDSHTYFIPPERTVEVEYGYEMRMIGDECYVTAVRPGGDAAGKGIKPGDRVLAIDGRKPSRATFWMMEYLYYTLRPQPALKLSVQAPGAQPREVSVAAKVTQKKRLLDLNNNLDLWKELHDMEKAERKLAHRYYTVGESALIWQMPVFNLDDREVDKLVGEAKGRKAVILDLRGNGGGRVKTLQRLVANFFDRDVTIGTLKMRDKTEPLVAKTRGKDAFTGTLVVLVDSQSGSASEIFARVVQLEKRGTVIGDVSAGAVMQSQYHSHGYGSGTSVYYGVSVTNADVVMSDGKSLEDAGVQPDHLLVPSAEDMAAGLDPVLAKAAEVAGFGLDPKKAGSMFPVEWE
jgi:C-terminal processing protease CtpA/Prc